MSENDYRSIILYAKKDWNLTYDAQGNLSDEVIKFFWHRKETEGKRNKGKSGLPYFFLVYSLLNFLFFLLMRKE